MRRYYFYDRSDDAVREKRQKPILIFDYDGTLHETMYIYKPAIEKVVRYLREDCGYELDMPSDRKISSWLGMNVQEMWQDFMPQLPMDERMKAGKMVGDFMQENLQAHMARWYDGVKEMLTRLKKAGYTMAILSNCGVSYAENQWKQFGMEEWFAAYFECESYQNIPKGEIMKQIAADFPKALSKAPVKRKAADSEAAGKRSFADHGMIRKSEKTDMQESCDMYMKEDVLVTKSGSSSKQKKPHFIVVGDRYSDYSAAEAIGAPFIGCDYGYGMPGELDHSTVRVKHPLEIVDAVLRCEDVGR